MNNQQKTNKPERKVKSYLFQQYINSKLQKLIDDICDDRSESKDIATITDLQKYIANLWDIPSLTKRSVKLVFLDNDAQVKNYNDTSTKYLVFLIPPKVEMITQMANFINNLQKRGITKNYHVVFYPKKSIMCKYYLEKYQIYGLLEKKIKDFNMDLMPLADDLMSLEYPISTEELFKTEQYYSLNLVAESIQRLQIIYGKIPNIYCKGDNSCKVVEMMTRMQKEHFKKLQLEESTNEIDQLIILDRSVDILTPLIKQLTYSGMLDENIGFNFQSLNIKKKVLEDALTEEELKNYGDEREIPMKDEIFEEIKDFVLPEVGSYQTNKSREFKEMTSNMDVNQDLADLSKKAEATKMFKLVKKHSCIAVQLKEFIENPLDYKALQLEQECQSGSGTDTNIFSRDNTGENILNHCQDIINRNGDLNMVYKQCCIQSIVEGGLKAKNYNQLKKEVIETYGLGQIKTFDTLEKNAFLYNRDTYSKQKYAWSNLRKNLKLINEGVRTNDPDDTSYAYCGYNPVSVKLVEMAIKDEWHQKKDLIDMIPGKLWVNKDQKVKLNTNKKKVVMLFMIGGLAYSEISALRLLGKQHNVELVICTTNMINYKNLINSVSEKIY